LFKSIAGSLNSKIPARSAHEKLNFDWRLDRQLMIAPTD